MRLKVEGAERLQRDVKTNAILNTDREAHVQYITALQAKKDQKEKMLKLEGRIDNIESMLSQILAKLS